MESYASTGEMGCEPDLNFKGFDKSQDVSDNR